MIDASFFDRDPVQVAADLVGKVIRRKWRGLWLAAAIVEAEAYHLEEKGSHASLGRTPSREALFMPPGTIYMYYARGGDSLNVSCRGEGNAVLFKSGRPLEQPRASLEQMHALNPLGSDRRRPDHRLCAGQTLLCKALGITVKEWDRRTFDRRALCLESIADEPDPILVARRLGIPVGRDEHLLYRFLDPRHARSATESPLSKRSARLGVDYFLKSRASLGV